MATVESFSTFGLDPRRKLSYWNDRATETFSPLVSDPADIRTFNGSIARATIGDLTLAEVYSDAQLVRHSRAHVARTRSSLFFLHLQMEGESVNRQDGREARLGAGDFTLCDSTRHYEIAFGQLSPARHRVRQRRIRPGGDNRIKRRLLEAGASQPRIDRQRDLPLRSPPRDLSEHVDRHS